MSRGRSPDVLKYSVFSSMKYEGNAQIACQHIAQSCEYRGSVHICSINGVIFAKKDANIFYRRARVDPGCGHWGGDPPQKSKSSESIMFYRI